jgi:predicted transposase YbfD/YdcC
MIPASIQQHFGDLEDPRTGENIQPPLLSIICLAVCGVICGADGWVDIELFGQGKQELLKGFVDLPHGIPSHDTLGRVFRHLNPLEFQRCFTDWTHQISTLTAGEVVAIDGKKLRGSQDRCKGQACLTLVNVWAPQNRLVLAQYQVADKSNEITAIPRLLELLDLHGAVVTMDAIGCQTQIVEYLCDHETDYVIAVKGNQGTLLTDIELAFAQASPALTLDYAQTIEKGHGRIELRQCWATAEPAMLAYINNYKTWAGLKSLVKVVDERRLPHKIERETRYFISSLPPNATQLLVAIRSHWQVENSLHWVLDVAFDEDACRVRKDHAPINFALLRQIALNLLNQETSVKAGIKAKRKLAGWNDDYLMTLLEFL